MWHQNLSTMKKYLFTFLLGLFLSGALFAQASHEFDWARNFAMTGTNTWNQNDMVVDASGNIIFIGDFTGTMDLDPGSGVSQVSTITLQDRDFVVVKLDNGGNFLWGLQCGLTSGGQQSAGITTDASGNIYVTGSFNGTCYFGTVTLISNGSSDGFLMKIDPLGIVQWVQQFGGAGADNARGLSVDNSGFLYISGQYTGTVDMDPGAGIQNLTSTLVTPPSTYSKDGFLVRLDPMGAFSWAGTIGGTKGLDWLTVSGYTDPNGHWDLYVGGSFPTLATTDLDPGAGYYPVTATGTNSTSDAFESKVHDGNLVWANTEGGTGYDVETCILQDGAGSVYTLKFLNGYNESPSPLPLTRLKKLDAATGTVIYTRDMQLVTGRWLSGVNMARDGAGNIYIIGVLDGKGDFDPGPGTFYLEKLPASDSEGYLLKLNANGDFQWVKRIWGSWSAGFMEVCTDQTGNVFTLAVCEANMTECDPGTGTYFLLSEGDGYAVIKYRNMALTGCLPPLAVDAYDISTTSIKIKWQNVTGATGYNLHYRLVGNSTWTTSTGVTSPVTISGLTSGARYEYQVQSVCGGTPGDWSTLRDITTSTCSDIYEANDLLSTAKLIPLGTAISARLGSYGDVDWYKFSNTKTLKCIHVELTNYLPCYRVGLYKSTGTLLAPIQQYGVSYNFDYTKAGAGTYYIKVSALNGTFDPNKCYNLLVNIYACPKSSSSTLMLEDLMIYPNPASSEVHVDFDAETTGIAEVCLFDLTGRVVRKTEYQIAEGPNNLSLEVQDVPEGMYLVQVKMGDGRSLEKIIISK